MGYNGEFVVAEIYSKRFCVMEHDGNRYTQIYRMNLPGGMDYNCFKAIDGDRIFLQDTINQKPLYYINTKLNNLSRIYPEGWLFDCIGDKLFCKQGTLRKQNWKIVMKQLYQDEESVPYVPLGKLQLEKHMTLQPPAPHGWEHELSICCVNESYAVLERRTRSFDIFDARGMICFIQLICQCIHSNN